MEKCLVNHRIRLQKRQTIDAKVSFISSSSLHFILGSALFIIGAIAGTVLIICPVSLSPAATLRDIGFGLISALWLATVYADEKITYFDVIGEWKKRGWID